MELQSHAMQSKNRKETDLNYQNRLLKLVGCQSACVKLRQDQNEVI